MKDNVIEICKSKAYKTRLIKAIIASMMNDIRASIIRHKQLTDRLNCDLLVKIDVDIKNRDRKE